MQKYVMLGCGGFLGAVLRYLLERMQVLHFHQGFPINTLIINVVGAFLLALILEITLEIWRLNPDIRLGVTTGLMGAFTTFSTLCKETVGQLRSGAYLGAISYVLLSMVLGLSAIYIGVVIAREIGFRMINKRQMVSSGVVHTDAESDVE